MYFNICTYNCCSLIKNIDIIRELTKKNIDIILLQEIFITEDKMGVINFIDEDYHIIGVPIYFSDRNITKVTSRHMNGLMWLWKANSYFNIEI